ncbi:uncharacterized protein J8A68_000279 [[Candida] subhashii]|uniref:DDHD domain-containing protein n=1 Tax=[Candida] subhashii TaxID=561895 RepID=A0A8J5UML6_9ASCO|nr:uncharacterized protein J8A68_000279 [[Candida] subhashii]KAG7666183.1 hypothetical protein J8A68_000279 [[Candida] subhashii]
MIIVTSSRYTAAVASTASAVTCSLRRYAFPYRNNSIQLHNKQFISSQSKQRQQPSLNPPKPRMRWYYAVDVPNSKPDWYNYTKTKDPENFIPFSEDDSHNLERHFLKESNKLIEVNEDRLFQVDLNKLELSPIYWEGPTYEVRRGLWFDSDGSPYPKTMADELEQGYQKLKPYTFEEIEHETETKENKDLINEFNKFKAEMEESLSNIDIDKEKDLIKLKSGDFAVYFNATQAAIFPGTYDSKYQVDTIRKFGENPVSLLGVKHIQRGYTDDLQETIFDKLPSNPLPDIADSFQDEFGNLFKTQEKENKLEENKEEDANEIDDKHMEHYLEADYDLSPSKSTSNREIDHLVLCIHGIGQVLGSKYESINFTHNVNVLRNTMKRVYDENEEYSKIIYPDQDKKDKEELSNNRIQVLPIFWRHKVDFNPRENFEKESRLPTLSQINVDGIKALRNVIGDVILDVLLYYQPRYLEQILTSSAAELNRVYELYKERNPNFNGKVHIVAHSLGSAIAFDLLSGESKVIDGELQFLNKLNFDVDALFLVGSPVGMFKLLEGKNIIGDPTTTSTQLSTHQFASPQCNRLYNVFHPSDPVSYRIEPLICPSFAHLKPEAIPFAVRGLNTQIQDLYSFGEKITQVTQWFRGTNKPKPENTRGKSVEERANSENALGDIISSVVMAKEDEKPAVKPSKRALSSEELRKLTCLNSNGRVDYCLPLGVLDFTLVSAVSAHITYFENQDVAGFIMKEVLSPHDKPVQEKVVYYN